MYLFNIQKLKLKSLIQFIYKSESVPMIKVRRFSFYASQTQNSSRYMIAHTIYNLSRYECLVRLSFTLIQTHTYLTVTFFCNRTGCSI